MTDGVLRLGREHVLAYRARAHGLHREAVAPGELAVLELGVQDARGSSAQAISARLAEPVEVSGHYRTDGLALAWSYRGAPHVHRAAELPALATALWPRTDTDALTRMGAARKAITASGVPGLAAYTAAALAMRDAVRAPTPRGEVSTAMTAALPEAYSYWCKPCAVTHVYGSIFQLIGLVSGTRLVPGTTPAVLAPLENRGPVPTEQAGTEALMRAYLALHGPATAADVAGYLGTTQAQIRPLWPDDLVPVEVDGRRCWALPERLAELRSAPPPPAVRLLPALDPWLQARDRALTVPDEATRAAIWKIIGNPGVVLVRGEVAGTWRARAGGTKRLDITITRTGQVIPQSDVEEEARRYAAVRGAADVHVNYG